MKKNSEPNYQKIYKEFVTAEKKADLELIEQDKQAWRKFIEDFESIQSLPPIEKAEAWLKEVVTDKFVNDFFAWGIQIDLNIFADQEALIYFISRNVDCYNSVKKMAARLKDHKKMSEDFWEFINTWSYDVSRKKGLQKKKTSKRKTEKKDVIFGDVFRKSFSLANDNAAYQVASMIRTFQWCDIAGYDMVLTGYANSLKEDVTIGGEINSEIASHTLFDICRSDFAIEIMRDNLIKLLDIIEMPENQRTIPWHRRNYDEPSLMAGIKNNTIFSYAASIAFAEKRLRGDKSKRELLNQALKWLLEVQEENGAWKISTLLDEPSIMSTCMVIHALAINKPRGWKLATSEACSWLISQQDDYGFWYDSPFAATDPIYLTVLVLDTLNLAKEIPILTFSLEEKHKIPERKGQINIMGNASNNTIIIGNDNTIQQKKKPSQKKTSSKRL